MRRVAESMAALSYGAAYGLAAVRYRGHAVIPAAALLQKEPSMSLRLDGPLRVADVIIRAGNKQAVAADN